MKILQLTPRIAFPPDDGGRISMANVTRHLLDRGADLIVVSLDTSERDEQPIHIGSHEVRVRLIHHSTRNSALRILRSLFDSEPLYLRKHLHPRMIEQLSDLIKMESVDVIHADHTAMAPLALALKSATGVPVGLRLHNIEWRIWERAADVAPWWSPRRWYLRLQASRLRTREAQCIAASDISFAISEVDAQQARELAPGARVECVHAGVNADEWLRPTSVERIGDRIVLASAWSWQHNVDGALWFLKNVLPLVKQSIPDIEVIVPGKNIPSSFREFESRGVRLIGYQERIQPVYHSASLFVVPLFVGSGVRIKILEAMAAGLPVISTTIGAEGIDASEENGLVRTDDATSMATTITRLFGDQPRLKQAGAKAQEWVSENRSWKREIGKMYDWYCELLKHVT